MMRDAGKVIGKPCERFKLTDNIFGFGNYGPLGAHIDAIETALKKGK